MLLMLSICLMGWSHNPELWNEPEVVAQEGNCIEAV